MATDPLQHNREHSDLQQAAAQHEPDVHGFLGVFDNLARGVHRLVEVLDPVNPGRRYPGLKASVKRQMMGPLPARVTLSVPADGTEGHLDQMFNSLTIVNNLTVPVFVWYEMGAAADAASVAAGTFPPARVVQVAAGVVVTAPIAGGDIYAAITAGGMATATEISFYAWPTVQPAWRG